MNLIKHLRRSWHDFWQWNVEPYSLWAAPAQSEGHLLWRLEHAGISGERRERCKTGEPKRHNPEVVR